MRTLSKPKVKTPPNKSINEKKQAKPQSKKVVKTVFNSPFRYKIQAVSLEDGQQVIDILTTFAKSNRSELGLSQKKVQNEKFISFDSKVTHEKPPLITPNLIFGIKNCIKTIKKPQSAIKMIVFFYDENIHDMFQELMCHVLFRQIPYLVLRESQKLRMQLGVKKILCLGILKEDLADEILKYSSRCLIDIPWLVDRSWISLAKKP